MLQALVAFFTLFLFWVLLSGYFTVFLLSAGAGSALAVVLLSRRMGLLRREDLPLRFGARALLYVPWLLKEIAKAAWDVTRIIVQRNPAISPTLIRFRPTQRTEVGLVMHANSITLTPGTITIEAEPGYFLVHALTRQGAQGVVDSEMDARVSACEERR